MLNNHLLLALASIQLALTQTLSSSKRGLIYIPQTTNLDLFTSPSADLTWYYNYTPDPSAPLNNTTLDFVPMLFTAPTPPTDTSFLTTVKSLIQTGTNITYVLAYNEPDGCSDGGACLDASTAAQAWAANIEPLKELGVKLGAPAVTGSPSGFTWLQEFFTACAGNCSADFIPVHWYGDFEGFASHVGQVNATYQNMSMWITEFTFPDQDLSDTQTFYNQSTTWLDTLSYVSHYSWFGAFRSSVSNIGPNVAFLTSKGELTDIGAEYLGEPNLAEGKIPSGAAQVAKFAGWAGLVVAACMYSFA